MSNEKEKKCTERLFKLLFLSSRGGLTRSRIIGALSISPMNAHQISVRLGIDYKTVLHHLKVLEDNDIIIKEGDGYGSTYRLSTFFNTQKEIYEELINEKQIQG